MFNGNTFKLNTAKFISTSKFLLLSISIAFVVFFFRKFFLENSDIYFYGLFGTKHSYLNWIDKSRDAENLFDLYYVSFDYLVAPEPLNALIGFFISNIFLDNFNALDAITFITLFTLIFYVLKSIAPLHFRLFAALGLVIGFYEYILLFDIYRFQLAFLFFIWAYHLPSNSFRQIFLFYLSTLCHLSIFLVFPIMLLLSKALAAKNSFSINSLLKVILLSSFSYFILLVLFDYEVFERLVAKSRFITDYYQFIFIAFLFLFLLLNSKIQYRGNFYFFILVLYSSLILFYFGTSRIIMLFYLSFLIFFLNEKYIYKSFQFYVLLVFFFLLMIHNIFRSLTILDWGFS